MIGSLIGAGISLASNIIGGVTAAKRRKQAQKYLESRKRDNANWYNRNYYQDATRTATAQRTLTKLGDLLNERNRAAQGRASVMGGTDASAQAAKAANAEAMAETMSRIAAQGEANKQSIDAQYQQRKDSIDNALMNNKTQQAVDIGNAAVAAGQTAADLGGAIDNYNVLKKSNIFTEARQAI